MNVVIEELKQRITAIAAKVRRYQGQVDSYRQNRLFENTQRQFFRELDQEEDVMMISLWQTVLGKHMESVCRPEEGCKVVTRLAK